MIAKITSAAITEYQDTGQVMAYIGWVDTRGRAGTTCGDPKNAHMLALLARAAREDVRLQHAPADVRRPACPWPSADHCAAAGQSAQCPVHRGAR